MSTRLGSFWNGTKMGATKASRRKKTIPKKPTRPTGRRESRRRNSTVANHGPGDAGRASARRGSRWSSGGAARAADPRVELRVQEVGGEVRDHHRDRRQEDDSL